MAPLVHELQKRSNPSGTELVVCVTSQHGEMLQQVMQFFGIKARYDLQVMSERQTPTGVASTVLSRIEPILQKESPDWVLVQGDTTTASAAALAAFYARLPVGHVEAGLRTNDKWRPFPEEVNRRLISTLTTLHFAPTQGARANLLREGVIDEQIVVTGNTGIDALRWVANRPDSKRATTILHSLGIRRSLGTGFRQEDCRLILVTVHRRESFGNPLLNICSAIRKIADKHPDSVRIVFPVHLNPEVQGPVTEVLENIPNIRLVPPLDYSTLVHLMKHAYCVLTDSGGIQEEAPTLGAPVLVLRDTTERPEAVEAGTALLVGTGTERVIEEVERLLSDSAAHRSMARAVNPFGDGQASYRIASALLGETYRPFSPR